MAPNTLDNAKKSFEDAEKLRSDDNLDEAYDLYVDGINKSEKILADVANGNEDLMTTLLDEHDWILRAKQRLVGLEKQKAARDERLLKEEERRELEEEQRRAAVRAKEEREEEQCRMRDKLASLREEVHTHAESRLVTIDHGSTNHGYDTMFGPCIDNNLRLMLVEEPYIVHDYQYLNFLNLVEMVVGKATALKEIYLCKCDMKPPKFDLETALATLEKSLAARDISFKVIGMDNLHDRFIRFDNGWTIVLGKGLHYFEKQNRFDLGAHNTNLRRCAETTIQFTKKSLKQRKHSSAAHNNMRRRCDYWPRDCENGVTCNFIHPDKPCPHRKCNFAVDKCHYVHLCTDAAPCSPETCTFYSHQPGVTVAIQDEDVRERINARHPGVAIAPQSPAE